MILHKTYIHDSIEFQILHFFFTLYYSADNVDF